MAVDLLDVDIPTAKSLQIRSFSGVEGVSRLFRYDLELVTPHDKPRVKSSDVVGHDAKVFLINKQREFAGVINRFSWTGVDNVHHHYRAELVPWLWQLSLAADCRIFHQKTVIEIVKEVFDRHGFKPSIHFDTSKLGSQEFVKWDYCVQYRETDLNFVARMLEQEGIFYYFDKGVMVLATNNGASGKKVPLAYNPQPKAVYSEPKVSAWSETTSMRPTGYRYRDYHFEKSEDDLEVGVEIKDSKTDWVIYDYPGEYAQRFDTEAAEHGKVMQLGHDMVTMRLQEERVPRKTYGGSSNAAAVMAGSTLTLSKHPADLDHDYFVTSVHHFAQEGSLNASGNGPSQYHNSISAIPLGIPFRPPRITPKPVIQGLHNATVVGRDGEEIDVDRWGRVRVKFHWDRSEFEHGENSCWIRVAQSWAGRRWGAFFWPRIGQEVLVAFQEGDPEEPIIVGSAYNDAQPPPYLSQGQMKGFDGKHPHNYNLTGIKSNSTLEGKGFNEWRFDDTKDKEQIFFHAQRDMDVRVRHDSRERVIHDRHLIVGWEKDGEKGGDQREMVYQDKHLNVKRDQVEHIEGNVDYTVGLGKAKEGGTVQILIEKDLIETVQGNELVHILKALAAQVDGPVSITLKSNTATQVQGDSHQEIQGERREKVGGGQSLHVSGDRKERVGGNEHLLVTSDRNEKIEGTQSLTVGQNQYEKVGMNHALEAGQEIHIKAGAKLILEAGAQLSLKGPGGFVDINAGGVTIVGTIVNINSGGSAGSGSGSKPKPPEAPQLPDKPESPPDAKKAEPTVPAKADNSVTGSKSAP